MHEGRTESQVRLADVLPGPHAWGVGALEALAGEVTVVDDTLWLARPNADGTATLTRGSVYELGAAQGAALLVVANVDTWQGRPVAATVPWSALDAYLEAELTRSGVPLDRPVAVRVEGPVAALGWHVIDGTKLEAGASHADHARSAVSGQVETGDVRLVGFFSAAHQGVFTHAGSKSHFHVVSRDGTVSGHVDRVDLAPGAEVLIPQGVATGVVNGRSARDK